MTGPQSSVAIGGGVGVTGGGVGGGGGVVPLPLGISLLRETVDAGAAEFTGTKEARITAALTAAVAAGKPYVNVPKTATDGLVLRPFNAALVPNIVTSGVRLTREGADPGVYDARAYGAAGDGVTNDQPNLQAAIDSAIGSTAAPAATTRQAIGSVCLPGPIHRITTPLTGLSVLGLNIRGGDMIVAEILVGANMTHAMELNGFAIGSVTGLSWAIAPGVAITDFIDLHWDVTAALRSTTGVAFERLYFGHNIGVTGTYINAMSIGTDNTTQVDTLSMRDVHIFGAWTVGNVATFQYGIRLGSGPTGNGINLVCHRLELAFNRTGMGIYGFQALSIIGGSFEGNDVDIDSDQGNGISIDTVRSEQAKTAFLTYRAGSTGAPGITSIKNLEFSCDGLTAHSQVIQMGGTGHLLLQNIAFSSVGAFIPQIYIPSPAVCTIQGLVQGPYTDAQTFICGAQAHIYLFGFTQTVGGLGTAVTNFIPFKTFSAAADKPAAVYGAAVRETTTALVSGVAPALNAALGNDFTLEILTNIAVVIAVPTNPPPAGVSQDLTITLRNASGGALTTAPTFNLGAGGFRFSAVTNPANGTQVAYRFRWDPVRSFWFEVSAHLAAGLA